MESKAVTRTKAHVKSKLKTGLLSQCSHHLIPGHNKNKSTLSNNPTDEINQFSTSELFQTFPYYCDHPKPLLPPSKVGRDCYKEDPTMQLIHTKNKIQDDLNRYLELYKKHSNLLDKQHTQNSEFTKEDGNNSATISKYLVDTAKILDCDPDPKFSGDYNWYYSGGTLNGILYGARNILVFPYSNELITLPIELKDDSLFKPDYKNAAKISINDNLYQVVCSTLNNSGRILARFKNNCYIFNLFNLDKKKLNLLEICNQPSEIPYISADLDPINGNNYCTVNVDRNIKVWDLSRKKGAIISMKVPAMRYVEDNWASVKYDDCNGNILKYTDRHCVYYYDSRLSEDRPVLTMCPKDYLEDCESLSCYVASCKSEYFSYVTSNHNLCLIDSRQPQASVVKKWSHQFKRSPLHCDVCFRENHEFIIFASQVAGETAIVLNNWKSSEEPPETFSTPYTPPSNLETLIALQSQGKCLDPQIRNRLSFCNTGCMATIDPQSNDIFLLTQNSVNDIFYQGISHQEPLDLYSLENCKSLYKLKIWNRQILKNDHHDVVAPLVVTKRTSAREMLRTFTNQQLQSTTSTNEQDQELEYMPAWKRSIAELNSFVDILASELLLPWEVVEDAPAVPITAAPHQKVLSWLGMAESNQQDPLQVESNEQLPTVTQTQEPDIIQRPDAFEENHDSDFIQSFLPKVKSQATQGSKKNKKKPNYVPVPVACVPTGVKHLHHKALEFDIGVYFEANGHGTVVFKDSAQKTIKAAAENNSLPKEEQKAAITLAHVIDVINQTVGDALSDMLLVELILHAKGWDAVAWEKSYQDLPNKQVKVKVQDRNAITTADAERCCVAPNGLQEEINKIVSKYPRGRSFVRPSGTEDVVRVYAECKNSSDVGKLAAEVSLSVYNLAGGIGTKPEVPA